MALRGDMHSKKYELHVEEENQLRSGHSDSPRMLSLLRTTRKRPNAAPVAETRVLDLWLLHLRSAKREYRYFLLDGLLYLIFWSLLLTQISMSFPSASAQLKQTEAIRDLLLDEEFPNVPFKKNFYDVRPLH